MKPKKMSVVFIMTDLYPMSPCNPAYDLLVFLGNGNRIIIDALRQVNGDIPAIQGMQTVVTAAGPSASLLTGNGDPFCILLSQVQNIHSRKLAGRIKINVLLDEPMPE